MPVLIVYSVIYTTTVVYISNITQHSTKGKSLLSPHGAAEQKYTCTKFNSQYLTLSKKTSTPLGHPSVMASERDDTVL